MRTVREHQERCMRDDQDGPTMRQGNSLAAGTDAPVTACLAASDLHDEAAHSLQYVLCEADLK